MLVPLQVAGIALGLMITVILWVPTYGLLGLVAPAVVIDGLGPARALRRSVWLAARNGMRAALIRVLGYASWPGPGRPHGRGDHPHRAGVRVAIGHCGQHHPGRVLARGERDGLPDARVPGPALHLDVRMRTEGLDIALRRSLHRGVDTAVLPS